MHPAYPERPFPARKKMFARIRFFALHDRLRGPLPLTGRLPLGNVDRVTESPFIFLRSESLFHPGGGYMVPHIRLVAVLGAGVMGSGIAAHLANAGIPCLMLDIVPSDLTDEDRKKGLTEPDPAFRNRAAAQGLEGIRTGRPALLYSEKEIGLISIGNFDDDLPKAG